MTQFSAAKCRFEDDRHEPLLICQKSDVLRLYAKRDTKLRVTQEATPSQTLKTFSFDYYYIQSALFYTTGNGNL